MGLLGSGLKDAQFDYPIGIPLPAAGDDVQIPINGDLKTMKMAKRVFRFADAEITVEMTLDVPSAA